MSLTLLLIVAFGGALLTYFSGKISGVVRDVLAVLVCSALTAMIACLHGRSLEQPFYLEFLSFPLLLRLNALSWFFAIMVSSVGALTVIFSLSYIRGRERTDFYYLTMLLVNAAMLGIVLSGDLISFYIFWEIMSGSAFLLISYNRGPAAAAGMKYIIMSVIGSVCMLIGMLALYTRYETLAISELSVHIISASPGYILLLLMLFFIAFGIKNAVWPFHTWLPPAHSEAPSPFSAVLSGTMVRMGMYGILVFFYAILGREVFMDLGRGVYSAHNIIAWLGAINIVVPTFIAMLQNDAKRLLAWHGIGQGGYMVLGTVLGTPLGLAGAAFHILNYTAHIALLFLVVGAVEFRTHGVRDLNSLGGLIKKMPIVFMGALIGACGLIGVPLTNGFVSKWLIYKTLILDNHPFLAFAALIGTWGTILSLYKFVHNVFLGQLPEKYKDLKKAPFSMQFPIIIFSAVIMLFGVLPGIPLRVVNAIVVSLGFDSLNVTIWGIASETGTINMINISAAIMAAGIVVWLVFRSGAKAVPVAQEDNFAAGAAIPTGKYHYTVDFYNPLYRMISRYLTDFIDAFYAKLAHWTQGLGDMTRRIYTGDVGNYLIYIMLFLALLILAQLGWGVW